MSFSRYQEYRDSGVEWLGPVPRHWEVKRLTQIGRILKGSGGSKEDSVESGVGCVRYGDLYTTHSFFIEQARSSISEERAASYTPIFRGDVLFAASGETMEDIGKSAVNLMDNAAYCGGDIIIFRPSIPVVSKFLGYACDCNASIVQKSSMGRGTTVKHIYPGALKRISLALPPLIEQTMIVAFLGREVAKIDALVAEQQQLIELLKEKRQAVISHAVTKGLNPRVSMKPSGVEWLGNMPAHWELKPVKFIAKIGNGSTPNREIPEYWGGDYPWLTSSCVNQEQVSESEEFVTLRALEECHLPKIQPPAVLVGITGQGRTRGMATTLLFEATINQHVAFLRPREELVDVHFLRRAFDVAYEFLRRESEAAGSTKGAITCEQIGNLKVPIPPLKEQLQIVSGIRQMSAQSDSLSEEAHRAVNLLEQRRSALISAAVTGQIDVRQVAERVIA